MKIFLNMKFIVISCAILTLTSCGAIRTARTSQPVVPHTINLALTAEAPANKYVNLNYGIRLYTKDGRSNTKVLQKYDASATYLPQVITNPEVMPFVSESVRRYMRTMGFNLDVDISTDYMLTMVLKEFNVSYLSGIGWSATVQFNVEAADKNRTLVYPNVLVAGRANRYGSANDFSLASQTLNEAYANALRDMDWDRIAFFLKKASSPELEANKQVDGDGNTALESTVIRWFVESSPRGAESIHALFHPRRM